ncbi:MAG: ATP-binding cassette domain-containing protein [Verrucomicrobia bacterium]|nr:ATP-binding cassette domain-containing protein [Verrucomicrobiota bacterium]MBS0645697.1 ATP-binding cassette domain-containing protein [Verrucomicrobiota bacterium]
MNHKDKIVIKNLTKRFQQTILKQISLQVHHGEIFGLIGPSGAGKTTLINCLTGLETPSEGEIWIDGEEISILQGRLLRQARRKLGMVFQQFNLFSSRTVLENIRYPLEICNQDLDVSALIKTVGLEGKEHCYPAELSGGQKQRVAIARALALNPSVLLCDEPTSALDPETTSSILELLVSLNREMGMTILFITHEMDIVRRICHRMAVLDHGEIIEEGSVADVFAQPKHPITKRFLNRIVHDLPEQLYVKKPQSTLLRLCFTAGRAEKPIICELIRRYPVEINILLGSIDVMQAGALGHLVVEMTGVEQERGTACAFLKQQGVLVEEVIG